MIILSFCNIYTNTILYTVEIHSPVYPLSWTPHLPPHPSFFTSMILSQVTLTLWGVKTPGQCYITWIIKYPFNPHPRQKLERHSYNQQTSVQPSFNVFLFFFFFKQSWHSLHSVLSHCPSSSSSSGWGGCGGTGKDMEASGVSWYAWGKFHGWAAALSV